MWPFFRVRDSGGKKTLERQAKISAVIDMVLAGIDIGMITSGIDFEMLVGTIPEDSIKTRAQSNDSLNLVYLLTFILITILKEVLPKVFSTRGYNTGLIVILKFVKLLMGYTLWNGAQYRDYRKCQSWLIVSIAFWVYQLGSFVFKLGIGAFVFSSTVATLIALLGRILAIRAVKTYLKGLKDPIELPQYLVV